MKGKNFPLNIILSVIILIIVIFIFYQLRAQDANEDEAIRNVDSRFFDVEKPCRADQVTITTQNAKGLGNDCLEAKRNCMTDLGNNLLDTANSRCMLFSKIKNNEEQCEAYRGNWDATENINFTDCYNSIKFPGLIEVQCWITFSVQYSCN